MKTKIYILMFLFLSGFTYSQTSLNTEIAGRALSGYCNAVYNAGDNCYYSGGCKFFSASVSSDRRRITELDGCYVENIINDIYVSGDYAYVVDGNLNVIDVSNDYIIEVVASINTDGNAVRIFVDGDYAYVSALEDGLQIYDVSNPLEPSLIYTYSNSSKIYGTFIDNNYAYTAFGDTGLIILDVSEPSLPVVTGYYNTIDTLFSVYVADEKAYLACNDSGLIILDITHPDTPVFLGNYIFSNHAYDVCIIDTIAYVACYGTIWGCSISDPCSIYTFDNSPINGKYPKLSSYGNESLIVTSEKNGVYLMSPPYLLYACDFIKTYGYGIDLCIQDCYAYVSDKHSELYILNIYNPTHPGQVSENIGSGGLSVGIYENYAITIGNALYYNIYDVTFPEEIELVDRVDIDSRAYNIEIEGNYLYLCYNSEFSIIDMSDFDHHNELSRFEAGAKIFDIEVIDNFAYIAAYGRGLSIIDISDPVYPTRTGLFITSGTINNFDIKDEHIFTAEYDSTISILDVSDRSSPMLIESIALEDRPVDIIVEGNYAYIICYEKGLLVYDVSNPHSPFLVGYNQNMGQTSKIALRNNHAYILTEGQGMYVVDISHFTESVSESPLDQIQSVPQTLILTAYPNPFNSAVSIELPYEASEIEIYDIKGNLCHKVSVSGTTYTWRPSQEFESGVYNVKVSGNNFTNSKKLIYLK